MRKTLFIISFLIVVAAIILAIDIYSKRANPGLMHDGITIERNYPSVWFAAINDPNKPDWEILPQEALSVADMTRDLPLWRNSVRCWWS
ncbi:MAG: hypothetical protein ABJA02_15150 [Acidobacteriota bacterium]